jgi:hypothetical protein
MSAYAVVCMQSTIIRQALSPQLPQFRVLRVFRTFGATIPRRHVALTSLCIYDHCKENSASILGEAVACAAMPVFTPFALSSSWTGNAIQHLSCSYLYCKMLVFRRKNMHPEDRP